MNREPLFMQELHIRQSKEYEHNKKLNLHQLVEIINKRVQKSEFPKKTLYLRSS